MRLLTRSGPCTNLFLYYLNPVTPATLSVTPMSFFSNPVLTFFYPCCSRFLILLRQCQQWKQQWVDRQNKGAYGWLGHRGIPKASSTVSTYHMNNLIHLLPLSLLSYTTLSYGWLGHRGIPKASSTVGTYRRNNLLIHVTFFTCISFQTPYQLLSH